MKKNSSKYTRRKGRPFHSLVCSSSSSAASEDLAPELDEEEDEFVNPSAVQALVASAPTYTEPFLAEIIEERQEEAEENGGDKVDESTCAVSVSVSSIENAPPIEMMVVSAEAGFSQDSGGLASLSQAGMVLVRTEEEPRDNVDANVPMPSSHPHSSSSSSPSSSSSSSSSGHALHVTKKQKL